MVGGWGNWVVRGDGGGGGGGCRRVSPGVRGGAIGGMGDPEEVFGVFGNMFTGSMVGGLFDGIDDHGHARTSATDWWFCLRYRVLVHMSRTW